jgi:hypothetical protein
MLKKALFFAIIMVGFAACKPKENSSASSIPDKLPTEKMTERLNRVDEMLENSFKNSVAELLSDDEFSKLFGVENLKSLNRIKRENYCLLEWNKPDWVERDNANEKTKDKFLNPKNIIILNLVAFGKPNIAADIFKQKVELRTEPWNDKIEGIGEGALWSNDNRQLIVLVGHYIMNIGVSTQDDAAANLPKAKELAEIIIPKLVKK